MKNFVQPGEMLDLVAPSGGVTAGVGVLIGSIFAVAAITAAEGETFAGAVRGVFDHVAVGHETDQAMAAGDPAYWDNSAKKITKVATGNTIVGVVVEAKTSAAVVARVLLTPILTAATAIAALTENSGAIGGTNNGDLPDLTASYVARTGSTTGTANGAWEAVGATNSGDVSGAINNNFEELKTVVGQLAADDVALRASIREVAAKLNALLGTA